MPSIGPNTVCLLKTDFDGYRPVRIEHKHLFFFDAVDIETGKRYTSYYQNFTMPNQVPSRYSQKMFNEMAPFIGRALNAWPTAILIKPKELSVETMARRLREAIQAKKLFDWQHPDVDDKLFAAHADDLRTSMQAGGVYFGEWTAVRKATATLGNPGEVVEKGNNITFAFPDIDSLERLLRLMSDNCFTPRPTFEMTAPLTPEQVQDLESRYDVGLLPDDKEKNKWKII